ncbi:MAG: amidohydrolase family protein [Planctomycetes bacterium]|nr:amidohydrolase family protein [Planctomycetota bacterium]
MNVQLTRVATLLALAVGAATATAQDKITALRGARILPGGAPAIDNGVLLIAQGRIQAVGGASTPIPEGTVVIDVTGKTITPGLIDANWRFGTGSLDRNEQGDEVTPHLRVLDTLDPADRQFERTRAAGVTTVHVMAGTQNVIGGLGAVLKTAGQDVDAMVLGSETSLRVTMGSEPSMGNRAIRGGSVESIYYRRPTTRMGVVWEVRKAFYDAKEAMNQTLNDPQQQDPGLQVLMRVLKKELAVVTTARSEQDIRTALRLAAEFGYTTVIDEAQEAHYVIDELAAAKVWVLVGAPSADRVTGGGGGDGAEPRFSTLTKLAAANVPFVITTGTNQAALDLVREAMFAVRNGIDPQLALDSITVRPAQLLGLGDRIGSLAAGKDADFVVWTADPFDPTAVAAQVWCNGLTVSESR